MQTDKEDLIIIALPQIRDISRLERDDALYGEDIGGVDVIPPGRILHILVGRLDEAVRRNGEAVRAFQNHFPVMPGPRFRQRVGIRLAHGEAYAEEVAVRFFQAGHDFQRFLENDPGGRLGFRSADVA